MDRLPSRVLVASLLLAAAAPAAAQEPAAYLPLPKEMPESVSKAAPDWAMLRGTDGDWDVALPESVAKTLPPAEPPRPAATAVAAAPAAEAEAAPAPEPANGTIRVIVEGVESAKGTVNVAVCDRGLSREGCPYSTEVQAAEGFVEAQFRDIPPGRYAVVGYHDANSNSEFDRFLGIPKEPFALSNKANEHLVPTFEDAAVTVDKGDNTFVITLKKMLGG